MAGCSKSDTRSTAFRHDSRSAAKHYLLKGKVVSLQPAARRITIDHEAIPGYMQAMTMPYVVENESLLTNVQPGDQVEADLVVTDNTSYLQSIETTYPAGKQVKPVARPGAQRYPQVGEMAHDFHLTTQAGKPVTLASYAGKPLVVDFIYTQCPLPQFCPLLNIKFAEMAHALQGHKSDYPAAQFLSVSIDPQHDTVPVLKNFSSHFDAIKGGNWNFATGTPQQVHDFASNMGLDYWPESGQVVHSVVVYLLDGNGKIAKIWYGNDWKPQEILDALKALKS
jgi:protein SCO1/2